MTDVHEQASGPTGAVGRLRHFGGFVLAGLSALATDLAVLNALLAVGLGPLAARLPAIGVAMLVSWLINRLITFAVTAPPSIREFARFAAVSWFAQAVNFAVYAGLLALVPGLSASLAVIVACFVSAVVAYAGFRFGVFRRT